MSTNLVAGEVVPISLFASLPFFYAQNSTMIQLYLDSSLFIAISENKTDKTHNEIVSLSSSCNHTHDACNTNALIQSASYSDSLSIYCNDFPSVSFIDNNHRNENTNKNKDKDKEKEDIKNISPLTQENKGKEFDLCKNLLPYAKIENQYVDRYQSVSSHPIKIEDEHSGRYQYQSTELNNGSYSTNPVLKLLDLQEDECIGDYDIFDDCTSDADFDDQSLSNYFDKLNISSIDNNMSKYAPPSHQYQYQDGYYQHQYPNININNDTAIETETETESDSDSDSDIFPTKIWCDKNTLFDVDTNSFNTAGSVQQVYNTEQNLINTKDNQNNRENHQEQREEHAIQQGAAAAAGIQNTVLEKQKEEEEEQEKEKEQENGKGKGKGKEKDKETKDEFEQRSDCQEGKEKDELLYLEMMGFDFYQSGFDLPLQRRQQNCTHAADEKILIFDWDDTLLASSRLVDNIGRLIKREDGKTEGNIDFLAQVVYSLLTKAQENAHVYIITNAQEGWVDQSCREYMPILLSLIADIPVLSARTGCDKKFPLHTPYATQYWKNYAFRYVVAMHCKTHKIPCPYPPTNNHTRISGCTNTIIETSAVKVDHTILRSEIQQTQTRENAPADAILDFQKDLHTQLVTTKQKPLVQILSIGDSITERNALTYLSTKYSTLAYKSIKLVEKPSIDDLIDQLGHLIDMIPQIFAEKIEKGKILHLDLQITDHFHNDQSFTISLPQVALPTVLSAALPTLALSTAFFKQLEAPKPDLLPAGTVFFSSSPIATSSTITATTTHIFDSNSYHHPDSDPDFDFDPDFDHHPDLNEVVGSFTSIPFISLPTVDDVEDFHNFDLNNTNDIFNTYSYKKLYKEARKEEYKEKYKTKNANSKHKDMDNDIHALKSAKQLKCNSPKSALKTKICRKTKFLKSPQQLLLSNNII